MKYTIKEYGDILKKTVKGWQDNDPFRQSAVIAYYFIFSLPALLVLVINLASFFFSRETVNGEISRQVASVMGSETAKQISSIVKKADQSHAGLLPSVIAIIILISGATGVFVQLQMVLNEIWGVKQKPNAGIMATIKNRILSFGLIIVIGFLLLVSLVISTLLASFSHWLAGHFSESLTFVLYCLDFIVSLGVISTLFALMFKYLPDVKIGWKTAWTGALITGILFVAGKYGLSFYFGKASPGSVYGAAGSLIIMLLWVSYSSMIVFFGAEFTQQYAVATGARVAVAENAEIVDHSAWLKSAPLPIKTEKKQDATSAGKLKDEKELFSEIDKKSLHLVVKKVQIKDRILSLFSFKKKHKPSF